MKREVPLKVTIALIPLAMAMCAFGICAKTCKMNVDPHTTPNSNECIRCGACTKACPMHALAMGIGPGQEERTGPGQEQGTGEQYN